MNSASHWCLKACLEILRNLCEHCSHLAVLTVDAPSSQEAALYFLFFFFFPWGWWWCLFFWDWVFCFLFLKKNSSCFFLPSASFSSFWISLVPKCCTLLSCTRACLGSLPCGTQQPGQGKGLQAWAGAAIRAQERTGCTKLLCSCFSWDQFCPGRCWFLHVPQGAPRGAEPGLCATQGCDTAQGSCAWMFC